MDAVQLGPEKASASFWRRRILWIGVFAWTAVAGFAIWWLVAGNGGPTVWYIQEKDLNQPDLSLKMNALLRYDLGLQRVYPWILLGPYLALVAWFFPLERDRLGRNLPLNALTCLGFLWACHVIDIRADKMRPNIVVIHSGSETGTPAPSIPKEGTVENRAPGRFRGGDGPAPLREPSPGDLERPRTRTPSAKAMLRSTILNLLAYGAITGLVHSVNFYRRLRERERQALALESNLANARLNTLKAQLQPHFLFNSLNAITALLRRDPRWAETTLVALSELLRMALSQSERQEGPLREELEFVQRYLQIQQTRFGDKLRVEQDIEPQALECMAPTLVLQPLVENAIRHGIEPGEKACTVRVSASREVGKLVLTVEDDGVGLAGGRGDTSGTPTRNTSANMLTKGSTGIGLANLRERLQSLYGVHQKLELTARPTGGVIVRVEIPWRTRRSAETGNSFVA